MTGADVAFILKTGSLEVASAGWQVFAWVIVGLFAAVYVALFLLTDVSGSWPHRYERPALPAVPPCPCCTAAPYKVNDCTCRDDCGVEWCQAAEPPCCPWCDTHACIDRTMCNCEAACGSWLCEAQEEKRNA